MFCGVVVVLLTWLLTSARGNWKVRAVVIVAAPLVAAALWLGRPSTAGWPTTARPAESLFVWAQVREPNPSAGDQGEIFVWLLPDGSVRPRAYEFPYSRKLHEQVQRAMGGVKHGAQVGVSRARSRQGSRGQNARSALLFYPHPPILLPAKQGG